MNMQRNEEMPRRQPEIGGEKPARAPEKKGAMAEIEELQQKAARLSEQLGGDLAADLSPDRKLDTQAKEKISSLVAKEKDAEGRFGKLLRWAKEKLSGSPKKIEAKQAAQPQETDEEMRTRVGLDIMSRAAINPENVSRYVAEMGDKIMPAKEVKPLSPAERQGLIEAYALATAEYKAAEIEAFQNPSPENETRLRALKDKKADLYGKMNEVSEELDVEKGERSIPQDFVESVPALHAAVEKVRTTELQKKKDAMVEAKGKDIDERIAENVYKLSDAFKKGEHPVSFLQERRNKLEESIQNSSTSEGQPESENARALKEVQTQINDLEIKIANASGIERFTLMDKRSDLNDTKYQLQKKVFADTAEAQSNIDRMRKQQEEIDEIITALTSGDETPAQAYFRHELNNITKAKKEMTDTQEMDKYADKLKRIAENATTATELIVLREANAKPRVYESPASAKSETSSQSEKEADALKKSLLEVKAKIIALEAHISQLAKKKREKKGTPDITVISDLEKSKKEMIVLLNKQSELEESIEEQGAEPQELAA